MYVLEFKIYETETETETETKLHTTVQQVSFKGQVRGW